MPAFLVMKRFIYAAGMKVHECSCSVVFAVFNNSNGKRVYVRSISQIQKKIQCLDLNSSVFKINIYDKDNIKKRNCVQGVYLTLIISDARLQYFNTRKAN